MDVPSVSGNTPWQYSVFQAFSTCSYMYRGIVAFTCLSSPSLPLHLLTHPICSLASQDHTARLPRLARACKVERLAAGQISSQITPCRAVGLKLPVAGSRAMLGNCVSIFYDRLRVELHAST